MKKFKNWGWGLGFGGLEPENGVDLGARKRFDGARDEPQHKEAVKMECLLLLLLKFDAQGVSSSFKGTAGASGRGCDEKGEMYLNKS